MKNIIFIAPPAAGKGTQARLVSDKYKIPHISTGDLLRDEVLANTSYGKMLKNQMDSGELINNETIFHLLRNRINQVDCTNGYILDGFPRSVEQAMIYDNLLKELQREIGAVIFINIDRGLALERTLSRLICSSCFASYNMSIPDLRPKIEGICDKCGHMLRTRGEDNIETFPATFNNYLKEIKPILEYYNQKGLLRVVNVEKTDTVNDVFNKIVSQINIGGER